MFEFQISTLRWIIENWEIIKDQPIKAGLDYYNRFNESLEITCGLCWNCDLSTRLIRDCYTDMMVSFPKFSGRINYPLKDFEVYYKKVNFADCPERLELAKHCLEYLTKINENGFKND